MENQTVNKPLYYSTYSFVAQVDGKIMEFVSEKEYEEYVESPIKIIKKYFNDKIPNVKIKIVFYQRKIDGLYFVYKACQYFDHKPIINVYTFVDYRDAFCKYKEKGGK